MSARQEAIEVVAKTMYADTMVASTVKWEERPTDFKAAFITESTLYVDALVAAGLLATGEQQFAVGFEDGDAGFISTSRAATESELADVQRWTDIKGTRLVSRRMTEWTEVTS